MKKARRSAVFGPCPLVLCAWLAAVLLLAGCGSSPAAPDVGLEQQDFRRVSESGFGDPLNSYAWSMAWFQGKLYVGTGRDFICLGRWIRRLKGTIVDGPLEDAVDCSGNPLETPDEYAAEIWRYTPERDLWERVYKSPLITVIINEREFVGPRDFGYRGMTVTKDRDGREILAVGSYSYPGQAVILLSHDGEAFLETFPTAPRQPFAFRGVTSFRSLVSLNDKFYMAPTSGEGDGNITDVVRVFETDDPVSSIWRPVSRNRFGRLGNLTIFEMEVFNDHLYAGTGNARTGFQIWKTDAKGDDVPYEWTLVVDRGAGRGSNNQGTVSMCAFEGHLYVGTGIQHGGFDFSNLTGPAGAELIRIRPDDSWDLVVGSPRSPRQGGMEPISDQGPGFGRIFNAYMWRMAEHKGWLYVGTFDNTVYLPYLARAYLPPALHGVIDRYTEEHGGFDLWKTRDGVHWHEVSGDGFGNRFNYGVRTLSSTPWGLFLGTANPFKDQDPLTGEPRDGGLEIWLGDRN